VQPLRGIVVVTVEQAVAAPLCTRHLGDLGARVIKVENCAGGDFARDYDDVVHGMSAYFAWANRNKESVALDLKHPLGRAALARLVRRADVLVQNLAPGAAGRLGLDPPELRAARPGLITVDISGYGRGGPYAQGRAHDLLVQAEASSCAITGSPGTARQARHPGRRHRGRHVRPVQRAGRPVRPGTHRPGDGHLGRPVRLGGGVDGLRAEPGPVRRWTWSPTASAGRPSHPTVPTRPRTGRRWCWARPTTASGGGWPVGSPVGPVLGLLPPPESADWDWRLDPIPALGEHTGPVLRELGYDAGDLEAMRARGRASHVPQASGRGSGHEPPGPSCYPRDSRRWPRAGPAGGGPA
jgi:hypothetical protein